MKELVADFLGMKDGTVYLAALELGIAPVAELAKKAGIPRSTCYLVLDDLNKRGLISQTSRGKKTLIVAESPEKLLVYLQQQIKKFSDRKKTLQTTLPQLQALYNQHSHKPTVRFYEALEGVKTALEETLAAREILVFCSGYEKPIEKKLSAYLDQYFEEVDKLGIETFELLGPAPDLDPYIKKYQSPLHQLKNLHDIPNYPNLPNYPNHPKNHIDKLIFGNSLVLISFEFLNAIVIEHKPLVVFEKKLFWQLWHSK